MSGQIDVHAAKMYGGTLRVAAGDNYAILSSCEFHRTNIIVEPRAETLLFQACLFIDCTFVPPVEEMFGLGYMNHCNVQSSAAV